jgi:hypothetical protein
MRHAGQSSQTGPAQHPQEHGFGLVIRRMPERHTICAEFGDHVTKQPIARLPGSRLQ